MLSGLAVWLIEKKPDLDHDNLPVDKRLSYYRKS
jgi:hypothetical protein